MKRILISKNLGNDSKIKDILDLAGSRKARIEYVPRNELDNILSKYDGNEVHQGVIAEIAPYRYYKLEDVMESTEHDKPEDEGFSPDRSLIVVTDHITDAGNLGAIIRSAESVGADCVVIPNKRCAQIDGTTYKTSAGALAHMPVVQVPNIASAIEKMKEYGFWVAGASEHADSLIWDANLKGKIILVLGNEGSGISRLVLEKCDFLISLPQMGKVSSLNVAQSATACMYEWLRQNRL